MIHMAVWLFAFLILDLIPAPAVVPADRGSVVVSDKKGNVKWRAEWTMDPLERQGQKLVRFTERGRGRVSPFQEDTQWSLEAVWSSDRVFQPLEFEKTINTASGAHLVTEKKQFDRAGSIVRFERLFPGGRSELKSLTIQPDTLAVEGIAGILRFFPFLQSLSLPVHILSNEPRLYSVTLRMRGKERIKTRAGEFECFKIELVPQLGLLSVFRYFYPRAFFWFTADAPHAWVRYEGLENGPGTPEVVMELEGRSTLDN